MGILLKDYALIIYKEDVDMEQIHIEKSDLRELCIAAVREDFGNFQFVPKNAIDKNDAEFFDIYFKSREEYIDKIRMEDIGLQDVPIKLRDHEICFEAVKQNGNALQYVPEKYRDREMCLAAVKQTGSALQYVPEKFRDHEMNLAAGRSYTFAGL